MRRIFSSDLHVGHKNIIGYCGRPCRDVDDMNDQIIRRWHSIVAPDDEVWLLGDIAMGQLEASLAIVGRLTGRIVVVAGNHDRMFRRDGEPRLDWEQRYLDAGIAEIHHGSVTTTIGGTSVTLNHFPYTGDSHSETDRYASHRPEDRGGWLIHGHVHDVWRQRGRQINVGIDAWGGYPVTETQIAELIADGPANLDRIIWQAA